jgi:hypothetical protein
MLASRGGLGIFWATGLVGTIMTLAFAAEPGSVPPTRASPIFQGQVVGMCFVFLFESSCLM